MKDNQTEIPTVNEVYNNILLFPNKYDESYLRWFLNHHREQALKAASEKAKAKSYTTTVKKTILGDIYTENWEVDPFTILTAYGAENIK